MHEPWDRLVDRGYEPVLTEEQKAELDRRLVEDDAAPDDVVSWEEVKAQALARIRDFLNSDVSDRIVPPSVFVATR